MIKLYPDYRLLSEEYIYIKESSGFVATPFWTRNPASILSLRVTLYCYHSQIWITMEANPSNTNSKGLTMNHPETTHWFSDAIHIKQDDLI